jgi:hypothetical protein
MLLPGFRLPGYRERLAIEVTNVHMTAYFGLAYTMECLCESLQELNMDPEDTHGRTPLCWAAEKGFVEVVDLLLLVGKVDINTQDRQGRSPLSWAAGYGRARVVERLVQTADIEINIRDERGLTPLALATKKWTRHCSRCFSEKHRHCTTRRRCLLANASILGCRKRARDGGDAAPAESSCRY